MALANLASSVDGSIRLRIVKQDTTLGGLVKLLSTCDKPGVQEQATLAIQSLADSPKDVISSHQHIFKHIVTLIVTKEGALVALVECLEHHDMQNQATSAFSWKI